MVLDGSRTARPVKLRSNDELTLTLYMHVYMHI